MKNPINLDVLVVYSADTALSSSVSDAVSQHPFDIDSTKANYNLSYAYLLDSCKKSGLSAAFTTSADVVDSGTCNTYWTYELDNWKKITGKARSTQVFDKLSPNSPVRSAERKLLFSSKVIKSFNDPKLFTTFFDKLETYKKLPRYTIPTVGIRSSKLSSIESSLTRLNVLVKNHHFPCDFSSAVVLKDRYGAGGNHVYKIDSNLAENVRVVMVQNQKITFVIQPFLTFEKGFAYKNKQRATDIRMIFHHDLLLQCYFRVAKADDFRCNEHQGGQLEYVTVKEIPQKIQTIAVKIVKKINKTNSLYALDFVISNSGRVYFIEGNIGPGIDWDVSKKINEQKSKQLINTIVSEFSSRISA